MASSRVGRLGASVLLSLVILAGSVSAAMGAAPTDPAPIPSDTPTAQPSPSDIPTVTVAPNPTDTASPTDTPAATDSPSASPSATDSASPSASPSPAPATKPNGGSSKVVCLPTTRTADLPAGYCMTAKGPAAIARSGGASPAAAFYHTISGKVTGSDGSPAADLLVAVTGHYYCFLCYDGGSTFTASDGTFSITEQSADGYTLMFYGEDIHDLNGYYSTAGTNDFSVDSSAATDINLTSADATGINVKLQTGHHITGTIKGGTSALAGVAVTAESGGWMTYAASDTTAGDGAYSIDVPNGTYHLHFTDYSGAYLNGVYSAGELGNFYVNEAGASDLIVSDGDLNGTDATLGTGLFITGKVTASDGSGLGGEHVYAWGAYYSGRTTTKADGTYSIDVADDDSYEIEVYQQESPWLDVYYDSSEPGNFSYSEGDATLIDVYGSGTTGIDLQLPTGFFIKGKVTGTGDVPLAGVTVDAEPNSVGSSGLTTTGADGTYAMALEDDSYTLAFDAGDGIHLHGYYNSGDPGHFNLNQDSASLVPLASADVSGIDVQLPIGYKFSGTITGEGNAPLSGIEVKASAGDGSYDAYATTIADGTFSMSVPVAAYTIELTDNTDAYIQSYYRSGVSGNFSLTLAGAEVIDLTTSASDHSGIDVQMPKAFHIQGVVTGTGGDPVGDVFLVADSGDYSDYAWTDTDGTYDFVVPAGSYVISLEDLGYQYLNGYYAKGSTGNFTIAKTSATPVEVTTDDVSGVDVTLQTGYAIQGTITEFGGGPIQDIEVDVVSAGYSGWAMTDADGTYSVPVVAGSYVVEFHDYENQVYVSGYYSTGGFTTDAGALTPVVVTTGNVTGIDAEMYGPPSAPENVTAIGFDSSAVVSWEASTEYGRPVTGYTVIVFDSGAPMAVGSDPIEDGDTVCTTTGALTCTATGLANGQDYRFVVYASSAAGDGAQSVPSDWTLVRVGDTYVPLAPARIVDSHAGLGLARKIGPYTAATFQVTGKGGVPSNATAVTGVVTVTNATGAGSFALTPLPVNRPPTSNLNFPKGDSRSSGATVTLSPAGTLSITYGGPKNTSADVYFDVTGYFIPGTAGATYLPVTPSRLVDTRINVGLTGKVVAGKAKTFQVTDRTPGIDATNIPSNAVAVTGNLTVTGQSAAGHLTLTPTAQNSPSTASIYFPVNDVRATGLTMMLSPEGALSVTYVSSKAGATASVVFDVTGYFVDGWEGSGATYVPVTPNRLVDTRIKIGLSSKLTPALARTFQVTGRVPSDATKNVPATAIAITGTLTVTGQTAAGSFALTPVPDNHPGTSTLNFPKGDNRATGVTVPLGAGGKESITYSGAKNSSAQVVFDVSGYFVN